MNLPWERTQAEEGRRKRATIRYWEECTGIKIGEKIKFKGKRYDASEVKKRGARPRVETVSKQGTLIDYYPHVALIDFGLYKRAIRCEDLRRVAGGAEIER